MQKREENRIINITVRLKKLKLWWWLCKVALMLLLTMECPVVLHNPVSWWPRSITVNSNCSASPISLSCQSVCILVKLEYTNINNTARMNIPSFCGRPSHCFKVQGLGKFQYHATWWTNRIWKLMLCKASEMHMFFGQRQLDTSN